MVGVLGGLLGGTLFNLAGDEGIGEFGLRSMFVAFVGAVVLLVIVGLVGCHAAAGTDAADAAPRRRAWSETLLDEAGQRC